MRRDPWRPRRNLPRLFLDDSPAFFHGDELIRRYVRDVLFLAAGPLDVDCRYSRIAPETKRQCKVTLRAIAGAASDRVPLLARRALDASDRSNAVAVSLP